jgi:predicted Ser/Thr protein kinase
VSSGSRMQFGPWVVLRRLGEGGFGVVYECQHIEDRRAHAAVKVLMRGTADGRMRERFAREHAALLRMTQEGIRNVPQVLEALGDADGEHPFYAMDFVHGTNFDELLYEGVDPRTHVRRLAVVARTMARAHALQLYHRDLKPSNLLLDRVRNEPVVVDFGSVRIGDESKFTMAGRGDLGLTPKYAPPEALVRGLSADASAEAWDAFSMGMILHDFLSGQPLDAPDEVSASKGGLLDYWLQLKLRGPLGLPEAAAARWPTIDALVQALTEPEPSQRPSLLQVAEALEEAATIVPVATPQRAPGDTAPATAPNTITVDEEPVRQPAPATVPEAPGPVIGVPVRPHAPRAPSQAPVAPVEEEEPERSSGALLVAALGLVVLAVALVVVGLVSGGPGEVVAPVVDPVAPIVVSTPSAAVIEVVSTPTPAPTPGPTPDAVARPSPTATIAAPTPTPGPTPAPAVTPTPRPADDSSALRSRLQALYDDGPDAAKAAIADPARLDEMLGALSSGGGSKDPELKQMAASVSSTLWGEVRKLGPGSKEQLARTLAAGQRLDRFASLPQTVEAGGAVGLAPFLVDEVAARAPKSAADARGCKSFRALLRQVSGELDGTQPWLLTACGVCAEGGVPLTGFCPAAAAP